VCSGQLKLASHSVLLRSVMHGILSRKASFCMSPESVRKSFAFYIRFSVSEYPVGSIRVMCF
jgi:hypothetical protein